MPDKESFVQKACSRILDPKKRQEVAQELSDHIEDLAEQYQEWGWDDDAAYDKAVEEMGDSQELCEKLGSIHSFFPALDFRKGMTKLCIGLLLQFFRIEIGPIAQIQLVVSTILILWALAQMSSGNGWLKSSYCIYLLLAISSSATMILQLFSVPYRNILFGFSAMFAFLCTFKRGIGQLSQAAGGALTKVPVCYIISQISALCVPQLAIWIAIPLFSIMLYSFFKARAILWEEEADTGIQPLSRRRILALIVFLFVLFLSPVAAAYYGYSAYTPVKQEYVLEDVGTDIGTLSRVSRIRSELKALSFPEEVLSIMSQSELLRYEGTEKVECLYWEGSAIPIELVSIYTWKQNGEIRFIQYYNWKDTSQGGYRERLSLCFEQFVDMERKDMNIVLLSGTQSHMPFSVYSHSCIGIEYHLDKAKEPQHGFLAMNLQGPEDDRLVSIRIAHQKNPWIVDSASEWFADHSRNPGIIHQYVPGENSSWINDGIFPQWMLESRN